MLKARLARTDLKKDATVRALVFTIALSLGSSLVRQEKQPTHYTCRTQGCLAQAAQEATSGQWRLGSGLLRKSSMRLWRNFAESKSDRAIFSVKRRKVPKRSCGFCKSVHQTLPLFAYSPDMRLEPMMYGKSRRIPRSGPLMDDFLRRRRVLNSRGGSSRSTFYARGFPSNRLAIQPTMKRSRTTMNAGNISRTNGLMGDLRKKRGMS